jgi:hypothetical protein
MGGTHLGKISTKRWPKQHMGHRFRSGKSALLAASRLLH